MTPELKAEWLEALRSGRYQQTQGRLRDTTGHCCIGVLADVIDPTLWSNGPERFKWSGAADSIYSSYALCGLTPDDKALLENMNDSEGPYHNNRQTFAQIANYIEVHL